MKSEAEVRQAFNLLGTTLGEPNVRNYVWGEHPLEREAAWVVLHALGWVLEYDQSLVQATLDYVTLKSKHYLLTPEEEMNG